MKQIKEIKLFVSCPSDIVDELDSVKLVVEDINKTMGEQNSYVLKLLNWKTDTYTQIGSDAQEVINNQIESQYDILVGLVWLKLGTPTKRDKSGTVEEINRALKNNEKEQLIYFKTAPPTDITKINPEELKKINQFKNELGDKGVLYHEFSSTTKFESLFRIQLTKLIYDKLSNKDITKNADSRGLSEIVEDKYSHITNLIAEVENFDERIIELDIFNSVEVAESHLNLVTTSLNSMSESMNDWTIKMESRSKEMNVVNNIKDQRLKLSKQKIIINLLASELLDFNNRIKNELPIFSENFRKVGSSYSNVLLIAKSFNTNEVEGIKESAKSLLISSENSLESLATLLKTIMELPPLNFKFNKAKRETEITIKDLTLETMEGIKLLNEALKD
ncbi:hypothetical protein GCM10007962_07240 [Yeosuana aromativorans]|uniref:DUF4062 domain-containing protein n=1 Tax=Yeosuana aromativorans TaxID=288019 RepID=A0A8J3BHP1_9FLAO|nr:hypothetical protein [Yeosuana aromativorans]GGK15521.1 hypothetical protein GCM10007962_07240 [Yeosuana aromativorans]